MCMDKHADLHNPYFTLQLSLFTCCHPSSTFIPWQNVWIERLPAIILSTLVGNITTTQQLPNSGSIWRKWKAILFCCSHWQLQSKQKFVVNRSIAVSHLFVSVYSRRPSGCGEGSREVKVLDIGRGERVAVAKKRSHFQIYNIVLCICFCPKQT